MERIQNGPGDTLPVCDQERAEPTAGRKVREEQKPVSAPPVLDTATTGEVTTCTNKKSGDGIFVN